MEFDWGKGDVIHVDGVEVARADRSWFRERAELQIGAELWEFRAVGWSGGELSASVDGVPRFVARRSGIFTSTWTIDAGQQLTLRHAGLFSTRLVLSRDGAPIGEAARSGLLTSRPRLQVAEPLDTRLGCFVLWVAYVELNRQDDGGSSAAVS